MFVPFDLSFYESEDVFAILILLFFLYCADVCQNVSNTIKIITITIYFNATLIA